MSVINKAAFLDTGSVQRDDLDLSKLEAVVREWQFYEKISAARLAAELAEIEVVVSNKIYLGAEQLPAMPALKLICIAATGSNNVDLEAAREANITVCNVRAYATPSVVQHVFALLLSLTTRLEDYRAAVQQGNWSRSEHFCLLDYPIRELAGKTLGIIGYGELGQAVARVAECFGMRVLIAKRNDMDDRPGRIALDELLPAVDVLSLHCPLTDDNHHLIAAPQLALMKTDAVLINTARGGLVDETALLSALQHNQIGGAAIDVIEQEPPPTDYALLQAGLPNLLITPHTAWASVESRQRLLDEVAMNIAAFAAGRPRNVIT